jgi:hypothetical protein
MVWLDAMDEKQLPTRNNKITLETDSIRKMV